jgi:hypothetical protein
MGRRRAPRCPKLFHQFADPMLQVLLFLPWLVSDIAASLPSSTPALATALCLGEGNSSTLRCNHHQLSQSFLPIFCCSGTGAVGCGLLHSQAFRCFFLV